jgi:preprotein translocase subunit SecY
MLIIYFFMTQVTVYGVGKSTFEQFSILQILLGSSFGSLMTLGIGPIVTASIILQMLVGSKLIPLDLRSDEGKSLFQGTQKMLAIVFSFLEAGIYVLMGAIPTAAPQLAWLVIVQLAAGGILVIFMDELVSKWGFGSGVGLFIVAGVAKTMVIRSFNPLTQTGTLPTAGNPPTGAIPFAITAIGSGEMIQALLALTPLIATAIVFLLVIYAQQIKVEIPLAFGSIRGFGRRWPLKFFYTSNLPVILIAALLANVQLMARMLSSKGMEWLGTFDSTGQPTGGLILFLTPISTSSGGGLVIAQILIAAGAFALGGALLAYVTKRNAARTVLSFAVLGGALWFAVLASTGLSSLIGIQAMDIARVAVYSIFLIGGAAVFSVFWLNTSGMDARSVAEQIQSTGMQIPGYRRDLRIMERVLSRYVGPLAVIGGAAVGALAAYADFTGALGTGTGILLATMIIYQLYEQIAMQHMEDMHPALRRLIEH